MTEKQTDSATSGDPLPPLSMLLIRAARIASFDAAEGWPDALTFDELAALQYPEEGRADGLGLAPSRENPKQTDFFNCLNNFVKRGDVQAVKVDRPALGGGVWPCDAIDRPAAVAFLRGIHEEPGELVRAWLGREWQPAPATESAASQLDWETLTPEQKKAAWDGMTKAGRQDKAPELVKKHGGNKTRAGAEVGISGNRIGQILKESEPEEPEAPLPVNQWTLMAGLVKPKRGKASR